MGFLGTCYRFREMLISFTRRDLRQRYVGSILGWPWPFIQPLMMLGVYYLVFNVLLDMRLPEEFREAIAERLTEDPDSPLDPNSASVASYQVVLLCCALVPWLITAEYLMRAANVILESGNLVKKMAFPSELIPVSVLGSYLINMLILFTVFLAVTWIATPFVSPLFWLFPFVVLFHALMLLGFGYLLATANVFVRDVGQLLPIFMNLIFFLTPIVYVKEILVDYPEGGGVPTPKPWVAIFDFNPLAYMIDLYRWTLVTPTKIRETVVHGKGWERIELSEVFTVFGGFALFSTAVFWLGYKTFMANKYKFADEI